MPLSRSYKDTFKDALLASKHSAQRTSRLYQQNCSCRHRLTICSVSDAGADCWAARPNYLPAPTVPAVPGIPITW